MRARVVRDSMKVCHHEIWLRHAVLQCLDGRQTNKAGVELSFATNTLGAFALTRMLEPVLKKSAPSRVIFMSSGGMYTGEPPPPPPPPPCHSLQGFIAAHLFTAWCQSQTCHKARRNLASMLRRDSGLFCSIAVILPPSLSISNSKLLQVPPELAQHFVKD